MSLYRCAYSTGGYFLKILWKFWSGLLKYIPTKSYYAISITLQNSSFTVCLWVQTINQSQNAEEMILCCIFFMHVIQLTIQLCSLLNKHCDNVKKKSMQTCHSDEIRHVILEDSWKRKDNYRYVETRYFRLEVPIRLEIHSSLARFKIIFWL